jgi:hypothetical protein
VLTLAGDQISAITRFHASLIPLFGLPGSLPELGEQAPGRGGDGVGVDAGLGEQFGGGA